MRRILEPLALKEVVSSVLGEAIWESSFGSLTRYGPKDRIEDLLTEQERESDQPKRDERCGGLEVENKPRQAEVP
jgi:hypothetical protein